MPGNLAYNNIGFRGLRVYRHCPFSRATENDALGAILILSILINHCYFQFDTWYICLRGVRVYWHCPFSCAP